MWLSFTKSTPVCMALFLFHLLLSVVLGGQNLAFPDSSMTGNRKRQKSCHTCNPVVLNLLISQCPRKYPKSSDVRMNWSSQALTFLLRSSGLPVELAPLSPGLRHVLGLTATFPADQRRFYVNCQKRHSILISPESGGFLNCQEMKSIDVKSCYLDLFWLTQNKEKQE